EGRRPQPMTRGADDVFTLTMANVAPGTRYRYRLDGERYRPDPTARWQPEGVHGPSAVVDSQRFLWTDEDFRGHAPGDLVIYELHVGTFTAAGTFEAIIQHLPALVDLGVTAVQLMPVAEFPGSRNWGYDGVHLYAPQSTYGGPRGLRRLVDACHAAALSVLLDVVYNHFGPEGNYLAEYGPYFTDRYKTPWGPAVNLDGEGSAGVRRHVVENGRAWVREFHIDGFRLDAIHAIHDASPVHILTEFAEAVREEGARLSTLVPFGAVKVAAGLLFAAPAVPLLFMGEEYGETAPFHFFTSFLDRELAERVRRGRLEEFSRFGWQGTIADPNAPATFVASRLNHALAGAPRHRALREYYRRWLALRRSHPALGARDKEGTHVALDDAVLTLTRATPAGDEIRLIANLGAAPRAW